MKAFEYKLKRNFEMIFNTTVIIKIIKELVNNFVLGLEATPNIQKCKFE